MNGPNEQQFFEEASKLCPYCDKPLSHDNDGGLIYGLHASCYEKYGREIDQAFN